ncbi:uncharacterized protein LOC126567625 [Anopheles maculipalpis]|uniref:uncharacterized protein LOC126567625 n=1 Tax=Anopheles maculipalpis TaxID=1496333 RepID=UPI0021598DBD|nr:uncharacterized protein LOC126567625 [Anopheles maculipalpis]
MPYVVVNKKNVKQSKPDVIVAASNWIKSTANGKGFVYLPKAKCEKVKELLENDTPPLKDWEKHECEILVRNIPTLNSAYKALNVARQRGLVLGEDNLVSHYGIAVATKRLKIDSAGNAHTKEIPVTIYESLADDDGQEAFVFSDAENVKVDPFGDVVATLEKPMPVLSSALPIKPSLPAIVVEHTKAKPNGSVPCINLMMQADKDPLGDVSTPTLPTPPTPKPTIVHVLGRDHTKSKPSPPEMPKPVIVNEPELIQIGSTPTPPLEPASTVPQISKHPSVVVQNNPQGKFITGKIINGTFITDKVIAGKVVDGNVKSNKALPNELPKKNDNPSFQLQNLLLELKSMIISNQADIKRQMCEGFKQMQHSFMLLFEQQKWESGCQNPACVEKNRFRFDTLTTIEDMKRFEEQLKDTDYRTKLHSWIFVKLKMELDGRKRMDTMFGLMFDKALHTQLNWSGQFGKEPLRSYVNISQLFKYIATTPAHQANSVEVATFFKQKVECFPQENKTITSVSTSTKAAEPLKPNTVNVIANNTTLATGGIGGNLSETDDTMDISYVECKTVQDASMDSRDDGSNHSSTDNPGTSSGGSQHKQANSFIRSMDKMDRFEKQLNDKKVQQQVHKWVDKTFGGEPDVEKRLSLLLNRLMDMKVLQHFKWRMPAYGQRRLVEYPNFIELFEYASRTVNGDKRVPNTELVANFFKKRFRRLMNKDKTWNDSE